MTRENIIQQIRRKRSYLCVGLDTDIEKIPALLLSEPDPVFTFNRAIIDATAEFCISYKINTAFYESLGSKGWESMEKTVAYIGNGHFKIADAKRGDIGNTSDHYAKAFFETMNFDAITLSPYMGEDSITPFLKYPGKWAIVLGLTSNQGAKDVEMIRVNDGYVYEEVMRKVAGWGSKENTMFVVGATQSNAFLNIRKLTPNHFYLVPGVGAQGGSLHDISKKAMNADVGLLINVSRDIIYQSNGSDFAEAARKSAKKYQDEMKSFF